MDYTQRHTQLAYETTRWSNHLWTTRHDASQTVSAARGRVETALVDGGTDPQEAGTLARAMGGEVFGRLYGEPEKMETPNPDAPWAPPAHDALDALPEWQELRSAVQGDPDFSALATADLMDAVASRLPELLKEPKQDPNNQPTEYGKGEALPGAADRLRAALRSACREAAQETAERKEMLNGLAPGLDAAPLAHEQEDPARMQLAEYMKDNAELKAILQRAGRLRRIAMQRKQQRSAHAREEVVDVERGADLGRVLILS